MKPCGPHLHGTCPAPARFRACVSLHFGVRWIYDIWRHCISWTKVRIVPFSSQKKCAIQTFRTQLVFCCCTLIKFVCVFCTVALICRKRTFLSFQNYFSLTKQMFIIRRGYLLIAMLMFTSQSIEVSHVVDQCRACCVENIFKRKTLIYATLFLV